MPDDRRKKPNCCPICGYYLTTEARYAGYRCVNPDHWKAAGLEPPADWESPKNFGALLIQSFVEEDRP